jgi:hypothetical protein
MLLGTSSPPFIEVWKTWRLDFCVAKRPAKRLDNLPFIFSAPVYFSTRSLFHLLTFVVLIARMKLDVFGVLPVRQSAWHYTKKKELDVFPPICSLLPSNVTNDNITITARWLQLPRTRGVRMTLTAEDWIRVMMYLSRVHEEFDGGGDEEKHVPSVNQIVRRGSRDTRRNDCRERKQRPMSISSSSLSMVRPLNASLPYPWLVTFRLPALNHWWSRAFGNFSMTAGPFPFVRLLFHLLALLAL